MKTYSECTSYKWLNDSSRNINYYGYYNQKCDDNLSKGWYRFGQGAGNQMNRKCTDNYYCSARFNSYLSKDHPGLYDGIVSRTVCFHQDNVSCCLWSQSIRVLNCGTYYVYELHAAKRCNARYCGTNGTF